jgi:hypothetical protein
MYVKQKNFLTVYNHKTGEYQIQDKENENNRI